MTDCTGCDVLRQRVSLLESSRDLDRRKLKAAEEVFKALMAMLTNHGRHHEFMITGMCYACERGSNARQLWHSLNQPEVKNGL